MLIKIHGVRIRILNRNFRRISIILIIWGIFLNYPELWRTALCSVKPCTVFVFNFIKVKMLFASTSIASFSSLPILWIEFLRVCSKSYRTSWSESLSDSITKNFAFSAKRIWRSWISIYIIRLILHFWGSLDSLKYFSWEKSFVRPIHKFVSLRT